METTVRGTSRLAELLLRKGPGQLSPGTEPQALLWPGPSPTPRELSVSQEANLPSASHPSFVINNGTPIDEAGYFIYMLSGSSQPP